MPRLQANLAIAQLRSGLGIDKAALLAASNTAQEHSEAWLTLRCMEALAESALADGDAQGCLTHADQLLALASRGDMRELVGQAHRLRGLAWLAAGDRESAQKELMQALTLAEQIGRLRFPGSATVLSLEVPLRPGHA